MAPRCSVTEPSKGRPLVTVTPDQEHTATLFFFHGLGDTSLGWQTALEQFAAEVPGLKVIAPTAPVIPVTINGGAKCTAWCDIACSSFSPMDLLGCLAKRPPLIEPSWVEVLNMVTAELESNPEVGLQRMLFGGFSLGGHMAAWVGLQLPSPGCAGVLLMSGVVFGAQCLQLQPRSAHLPPVLHCHGTADMVIPHMSVGITKSNVEAAGVKEYEVKTYEGLAHSANEAELADALAFLRARLDAPRGNAAAQLPLQICSNGFTLPPGTEVIIGGLKSRPELRGTVGKIDGYNARSGRYTVTFAQGPEAAGSSSIALGAASFRLRQLSSGSGGGGPCVATDEGGSWVNADGTPVEDAGALEFPQGAIVRLRGLQKGAPWNGCAGRVEGARLASGRYRVDLGNGATIDVKPDNLTL